MVWRRRGASLDERGARRALPGGFGLAFLVLLALAGSAAATPTATLKVTPLPIPGFAGTGNMLGAGAEVEVRMTIAGSEYGGLPSPLVELDFYSPMGVRVSSAPFATCAPAVLEANGPTGCPKASRAGPVGEGLGVVTFGSEQVPEKVSIQSLFAPGGGLTFYVEGRTPTSFQVLEQAHWVTAAAPFGSELIVEVPLVQSISGGNYASILSFHVSVGAAFRSGGRTVSYITLPKSCPKGGFPVKAELKFMSGETVTVPDRRPCPARR